MKWLIWYLLVDKSKSKQGCAYKLDYKSYVLREKAFTASENTVVKNWFCCLLIDKKKFFFTSTVKFKSNLKCITL